jgi:hypothetical protein
MACITLPWAPCRRTHQFAAARRQRSCHRFQNRCSAAGMRGSWKLRHGRAPDKPDGRCAGSRIVR